MFKGFTGTGNRSAVFARLQVTNIGSSLGTFLTPDADPDPGIDPPSTHLPPMQNLLHTCALLHAVHIETTPPVQHITSGTVACP